MELLKVKLLTVLFTAIFLVACSDNDSSPPDADGDGVPDQVDAFPLDKNESADKDLDGIGDNSDHYPNNPAEWADSDDDGLADNADAFPLDATERLDTDGDGIGNNADNCFLLPNPKQIDSNNDGLGDKCSLNDSGTVLALTQEDLVDCGTSDAVPNDQQDCNHGRDAQYLAGSLEKVGSSIKGYDLTRLDDQGNELPPGTEVYACVKDNVTGAVWEAKNEIDGSMHADSRYMQYAYGNIDPGDSCPFYNPELGNFCNTETVTKILNEINYCGRNNWSLPSYKLVVGLENYGDLYSMSYNWPDPKVFTSKYYSHRPYNIHFQSEDEISGEYVMINFFGMVERKEINELLFVGSMVSLEE